MVDHLSVTMQKILAIPALFLVALLASCGAAANTPYPSATPQHATATETATPSPSPTPNLTTQAAQAYLQAATTADNADSAIPNGDLLSNPSKASSLSQLVPPVKAYDQIDQTFLNSLYAIHFPTADQADASALIRDVTQDISDGQGFVADPNTANWTSFADVNTAPDANVLRHDLGLPQLSSS